jgi:hypothetical protein
VFLRAFGDSLNPVNLIVAYGVAGVLAAIPITPGGLGVVETALPALIAGFGARATTAGLAVLSWRFVQFWLPIPLGGIAYATLRFGDLGRRRRLESVREFAHEAGVAATRRVWDADTGQVVEVPADPAELVELSDRSDDAETVGDVGADEGRRGPPEADAASAS